MYPVAFLCSKDVNKSLFCSRNISKMFPAINEQWEKDDLVVKLSRRKYSDLFNAINNKK